MNRDEIAETMAERGLTAPHVTQEQVDKRILAGQYHQFPGTTVTVCVLTLDNGFTVVGESACADPENFDEEFGRKIAYDRARDKIFKLEGFLLCEREAEARRMEGAHAKASETASRA